MKAELTSLDAEPLAGASGIDICRRRADAFDRAIRSLAEPHISRDFAVLALGGYGRQELCPGSDLDLLFGHEPGREDSVSPAVDAVLYPLWDAGFPVSHTIRTPDESRVQSELDLASLTSLLDARLLLGSAPLWEATRAAAFGVVLADPTAFLLRLEGSRDERGRRFGDLGRILEGDLREALGGLRDCQVVRWCLSTGLTGPAGVNDPIEGSRDFLLLVRTALHRASASRSNRLVAELHLVLAAILGMQDQEGWEARDLLVRTVALHAREVKAAADAPGARLAVEGPEPESVWEQLERTLSALPEWAAVAGRPQRDPYHLSHVDSHLVETLGRVQKLLAGPDEPFAQEAGRLIDDPRPLLLGAILHDIGKVGRGSHVALGVEIAGRVMERLGLSGAVREDALFLVGEHLLLADTATRRNIEDEDLVLHVAARIGDQRRLAMLYLLTVADADATGPSASTPWRLGLIRDLVSRVSHVFARGLMDPGRAARLEEVEALLRAAMSDAGRTAEEADAFVAAVPTGYVLWADPADAPSHAGLFLPRPGTTEVRTHIRSGTSPGTHQLSVGATDRLGLLAAVAGSLTIAGLTILSAHAFTTEGGVAIDVFDVRGAFEDHIPEERWERFRSTLSGAIEGRIGLAERVRRLRAHYPPAAPRVPITVRTDQEASDFSTVVEVGGPDRPGLLFDLAQSFADQRVDVHVAKVATYGPRVLDVFYVRDEAGEKLADPDRIVALERVLRDAVSTD